jgi:hypothetical protein
MNLNWYSHSTFVGTSDSYSLGIESNTRVLV